MRSLPKNFKPGKIVDIKDVPYVFDRIDPDGSTTFSSLRDKTYYMVRDENGFPCKPTADHIAKLMAAGDLVLRAPQLANPTRERARKTELDARAAREQDPKSEFRIKFLRHFDKDPCSLSDTKLQELNRELLQDPVVAALPGAKVYAGSTLRDWISDRGHTNDRRMRDGVSMQGQSPRVRRVGHPKEILLHYVGVACSQKNTARPGAQSHCKGPYDDYAGEIGRINRGEPTGRSGSDYPQPEVPYKPVSLSTFWRIVTELRSSATTGAKYGAKAVASRFGGGGKAERVYRSGFLAVMDDTPVPNHYLVDDVNGIPLGMPTLTLLMCTTSKCILGWDLSWDRASAATALRTYAHANSPKVIPAELDATHPELKWICCRPTALLVDNLHGHHSRHFEDATLDAGTDDHFAGAEMPTDKAEGERIIGTILALFVKSLPTASYDIPRAREFGFEPSIHKMTTLKVAREHLANVINLYHLTPHGGLGKRQPALVFKRDAEKYGVAVMDDLDEFKRAIGNVEHDVELRPSGLMLHGLRYTDYRATRDLVDSLVALKPPSECKTKRTSLRVKVKYDPDNIGAVHVWNEHTKRYVTLPCDNPRYAEGLPLWAHDRVRAFAVSEARAFHSHEDWLELRKSVFENARRITPEAEEDERRAVAKLNDTPLFNRVFGRVVEVKHETANVFPAHAISTELGATYRRDATEKTPRPKPKSGKGKSTRGKASEPLPGRPNSTTDAEVSDNRAATPKSSNAKLQWGVEF